MSLLISPFSYTLDTHRVSPRYESSYAASGADLPRTVYHKQYTAWGARVLYPQEHSLFATVRPAPHASPDASLGDLFVGTAKQEERSDLPCDHSILHMCEQFCDLLKIKILK